VIRLVVVGVAGTRLAPEATVDRAFDAALAAVGLPPHDVRAGCCRELFDELAGRPVLDTFRRLFGTEDRAHEAAQAFEQVFLAELPGRIEARRPDVVAALRALRADGVRTALTTGLERTLQDGLLQALGWFEEADVEATPFSGRWRGAPYPDLVLHALLQLRVDNVRHVAVAADTASALLSGWSAGAWIVAGVGNRHHQPDLSVAPHTHLLADFGELAAVVASRPPRPLAAERLPAGTGQGSGSSGISATAPSSRLTVPVSANTT
jgi:phosphoglycolate phosphatase-like HAD superfamily hydrolase